jgi:adenylate kinase
MAHLELKAVVLLNLEKSEAVQRLSQRRVCRQCGAVYNLAANPPKKPETCDRCGGPLVLREDDRPEAIWHRFEEYERETRPVEAFFRREYAQITLGQSGNLPFETLANETVRLLESARVVSCA